MKKDKNNLIISDKTAKNLIENMTTRHAQILNDFKEDREHNQACCCWLCRFRVYEKMKMVGAPYDYKSFLAYDILYEIKNPFSLADPIRDLPIKRIARIVIDRLPLLWPETKKELNDYARELYKKNFSDYYHKGRFKADKFFKLNEEITFQIYKKNPRQPVKTINLKKDTPASLALKVANFIYSKPDHKATEREIYRKFNKKKNEIVALRPWLKIRFGIIVPDHEKWEPAVYIGKEKYFQVSGCLKSN
ncbi:hypothetical protein GF354_05460 [Candidatus Peregrinibacteria bacterium]|nr:hypothetical protein [Candidatus Peregrinibacteria bacterium]